MSKDSILVGLEIGTSKICVVVGENKGDGTLSIIGVGQAPSRGIRKGEIVDFDTVQKCVREALVDAEEKSDVMIESVYLGITGSHITSFNNRGVVNIQEDQDEIDESDCELVKASAQEVSLPPPNTLIHSILQHYYVDGQEGILNPVGLMGARLEADYHIIHGIKNRIQNTIKCVKELDIEVEDIVFNPYATAQVVLDLHQKNLGALVIDIGGGTTDYIVYVEGVVKQSGALAVGGDHINNDISMGLRIPLARAERLKLDEGSALIGNELPGETVFLKGDHGFIGKEIDREMLNTIIHLRVREILEMLRRKLVEESYLHLLGAGIFITGGTSHLKRIKELAHDVFEMPVHLTHAHTDAGVTAVYENPQFSTAIGLVRHAQAMCPINQGGFWNRLIPRFLKNSR